ncbi:11731_t:CDS:2, partial [Gigaspora rosea]
NKHNKEEVLLRNSTKRQVLESSNKENSLPVLHTHRGNSSNFSNEASFYQTSASTIKSEESQADILKEILGRLMAIEEK